MRRNVPLLLCLGAALVAACGGSIFVKRVQPKGQAKVKAPEFVAAAGVQVGDKLG